MDYELIFWVVGGIIALVFFLFCWIFGSQSDSLLEESEKQIEEKDRLNKDG